MHSDLNGKVALIGPPNSGKTTLYNWLTGSRYKTVNYPGSTVDFSVGKTLENYGQRLEVIDTPGTYSLFAKSPDERITQNILFDGDKVEVPRLVIVTVDGTQIERHLLLVEQLKTAGFPIVVAVTMADMMKVDKNWPQVFSEKLGVPVVMVDGRMGGGVRDLVSQVQKSFPEEEPFIEKLKEWEDSEVEKTIKKSISLARQISPPDMKAKQKTAQFDKWLLHPVFGLVFFIGFMSLLFSAVFWMATPLMDLVDSLLTSLGAVVATPFGDTMFANFLTDGIFAGFASVLVFVPQIIILFLGLIFFEDTGYLARAASLIDKPLSKVGLNGRSFVPILSGYACAIPAMMAARTVANPKERWLTLFILPLMSCSARLPVYALLLAFLFRDQPAWYAGLTLTAIYFISLFIGAVTAQIASRFIRTEQKSYFMLELPPYRRPRLRKVLRSVWTRSQAYIRRAGPIIFAFSILLWFGTNFPNYDGEPEQRFQTSFAAQAGQVIEPVMQPMGGDWRVGVGLISAFAAREVFVSAMAIIFHVTEEDEDSMADSLLSKVTQAKAANGLPLFTTASVIGLIVFFMIALQCISTVAVARREFGSWKPALLQLAVFNVVAYALAVVIVQGLRAMGIT